MPCRCLLADSFPDMAVTVREYIESIPDDQKTSEVVYRERLDKCKACESLRDGTCSLCGCYVEARAAKARMTCPAVPSFWDQ